MLIYNSLPLNIQDNILDNLLYNIQDKIQENILDNISFLFFRVKRLMVGLVS